MLQPRLNDTSHWLDESGVHINAHGGGLLLHEGVYYWYGEHKIEGEIGNTAQVGVHVYASHDLAHWRDAGVALAVSDDPRSDITRGCTLERPKVLYNALTHQFVMWFHLEFKGNGYLTARSGVAVSTSPTGPFSFVRSFRPNAGVWPRNAAPEDRYVPSPDALRDKQFSGGPDEAILAVNINGRDHIGGQMARDMTLFLDDDGCAYHLYASEENGTMHISRLTDNFLASAGDYVRVFPGRFMEAPAICKHAGRYWLIASGCTGWAPNAARSAVADSVWGPWTELGNPCVGPDHDITFGGQSTFLQTLPDGRVIALFDIWKPENPIDGRYLWLPVEWHDGRMRLSRG
jgi:Glycosyl hydrolases family 43